MKQKLKVKSLVRPIICKLDTSNCAQDMLDSFNAQREAVNQTCQLLFPFVKKNPAIVTSFGIRDAVQYKRTKLINVPQKDLDRLADKFDKICDNLKISKKRTIRRDILTVVNDMYLAIRRRFKNKDITMCPTVKSNKAIRSNEGLYKIVNENNQRFLKLEILEGKQLKIPFEICNKNTIPYLGKEYKQDKNTTIDKNSYGGIIELKERTNTFVAKLVCRIEFNELYKPKSIQGIDVNKREDAYLAFSDGNMVARPKEISELCAKIKTANEDIKKATCTKDRSLKRKQWVNLQRKLKNKIDVFANDIIKDVIKNKQLLCIDGAKPGASNGEYGQILTTVLRTKSERLRIPHIWVDEYYTSTTCVKCNHRDKKNRLSDTEFKCVKCGHKEDADIHSAKYIAQIGEKVYKSS